MGKIKFKLSVKELSFEFEGDQETGQRFQNSISKTLNSLTDTPNHVIDVEARTISNETKLLSENSSNGSSKRRRKGKKPAEIVLDENGNPIKVVRQTRPSGQSCNALVKNLNEENFFSEYRTTNDVREELSKRGHHFESKDVASVLLILTKSKELTRDKNADDIWLYKKQLANTNV